MSDKPYGVKAERLWLGVRISIFDPKIGEPYASQIEKEIDEYVSSVVAKARSKAYEECAKIADDAKFGREATARSALAEGDTDGSVLAAMQARMADVISQAIRQHSQKGRDTE